MDEEEGEETGADSGILSQAPEISGGVCTKGRTILLPLSWGLGLEDLKFFLWGGGGGGRLGYKFA